MGRESDFVVALPGEGQFLGVPPSELRTSLKHSAPAPNAISLAGKR